MAMVRKLTIGSPHHANAQRSGRILTNISLVKQLDGWPSPGNNRAFGSN